MQVNPNPIVSSRYTNTARRELVETFRQLNRDCDSLLASTGCPMSHVLEDLARRQSNAEACLAALCQPYEASGANLPVNLVILGRNKDKTAHKVQMLHTLAPIRQANFDRFEQSKTPEETREAYARICETAQRQPHLGLDPADG